MEREIEIKFDVPIHLRNKEISSKLDGIFSDRGYSIADKRIISRDFVYYDTSDYAVYRKGWTIRSVGVFNPDKHEGVYRYDVKIGPVEDRYESQIWSDKKLSIEEALECLGVTNMSRLISAVQAKTNHTKSLRNKEENQIETSFDQFIVEGGHNFSELELELERGDKKELDYFSERIERELALQRSYKQKYSRALESTIDFQRRLKGGKY